MIRNIAVILLYNDKKQILLQLRDENAPILAGYWGFFGGGLEQGETPEQALRREIMEELEYELESPKQVMVQEFKNCYYDGKKYVFAEKFNPAKKLNQKEGRDMGWFSVSDALNLKMGNKDKVVLEFVGSNRLL